MILPLAAQVPPDLAGGVPWGFLVLGGVATLAAAGAVVAFGPRPIRAAAAVAVLVLGTAATGMQAAIRSYRLHLHKLPIYPPGDRQLTALPTRTPGWQRVGSDVVESPEIVEVLGTSNYVTRHYAKQRGEGEEPLRLTLHAAYYTGMIDTVPHVPERCFVGGGLQQASFSKVLPLPLDASTWHPDPSVPPELGGEDGLVYTVRLAGPGYSDLPNGRVRLPSNVAPDRPFRMNVSEFSTPDGSSRLYAGYFFIANGGMVPTANEVRTLAFDLRSDYAFYCKVQVTGSQAASMEEFAEQAADLLDDLIGEIMRCVPDWTEVQQRGAAGTATIDS